MTPNIQPVHRVPAEMLRIAEGELQSQIRSVGATGATGDRCMVLARWTVRDEHFISADLPWSHEHLRSTNDFAAVWALLRDAFTKLQQRR